MDVLVIENLNYCAEFVSNLEPLLFYTHLPTIAVSLLLGLLVLSQNIESRSARYLFAITAIFSLWSLVDLIVWLAYDMPDIIVFLWSFFGLLYLLVYVFGYAFFVSHVLGRALLAWERIVMAVILFPVVFLLPTALNVEGYDLVNCQAFEGAWYSNYYYWASLLIMLLVLGQTFLSLKKNTVLSRTQTLITFIGLESFLFLFFAIGYLVSYFVETGVLSDFGLEQYGLLGMPVFIAFLAYAIVKFKAFNIRLIAAQALVAGLALLIASQWFLVETITERVIVIVTLILSVIGGFFLVRSVQQEIRRKEELQKLSDELASANERLRQLDSAKSEFISIASHQLRTPLTAIKGFVSLLLEGAYGKIEPAVQDTLNKVYLSNSRLMMLVENLLNISRIESGRIQYQFAEAHIEDTVKELLDIFALPVHQKGLKLSAHLPKEKLPTIVFDASKIRETLSNLIDNAIKYTKEGTISLEVKNLPDAIEIIVADTGIGIDAEDLPRLFGKFERGKQSAQVNVSSTGLGLYVGKNFVEAHGGTITVASPGVGRGSRFTVTLPLKPKAREVEPKA